MNDTSLVSIPPPNLSLPPSYIGVFDSGIGGLSVLQQINTTWPEAATVYYADQAHFPYGPKLADELHGYVDNVVQMMIASGAAGIVLACHSASAASLQRLRASYPEFPFIGLEPAVKPAAEATKTGVIGVLTTRITSQGTLYKSVVERFASEIRVITQVAPELVVLAENGDINSPHAREVVARSLSPLIEANADQIVLACTHFPFLAPIIQSITGAHLVDPASGVARQTQRVLEDRITPHADRVYLTSGDPTAFSAVASRLLNNDNLDIRKSPL